MAGYRTNRSSGSPQTGKYSAAKILDAALATSSRKSYSKALKTVYTFLRESGRTTFPTNPSDLVEYIVHACNKGIASSSITSQMSALAYVHKMAGVPDPTQTFLIRKMLIGARNLNPSSDIRLPFQDDTMAKMVSSLQHISLSGYNRTLLHAMYTLPYSAFLRLGEMRRSNHNLQAKDLSMIFKKDNIRAITLTFRSSKHSKAERPITIRIPPRTDSICPVAAMRSYITTRGSESGPLFAFRDQSPVSRTFFTTNLNHSLRWAGLDPEKYKGHSFRIGAATSAALNGVSDAQIEAMGRWKSKAYKRYIRIPIISK